MPTGDHQMVEQRNIDRFTGERETARDLAVAGAGRGIAAGVVMGQDEPGAAVAGGVGDHLPHGQRCAAIVAVMARQMDAARLIVEVGDPQMFLGRITFGKAAGEEAAGRIKAVEQQRGFGTLMKHGVRVHGGGRPSDWNRIHFDARFWSKSV